MGERDMRKLVPLLLLVAANAVHAVEQDKAQHTQAGFLIGVVTHSLATDSGKLPMLSGVAAGCAAGLAKELYDAGGRGKSETKDFLFTCGGALVGSFLSEKAVLYPGADGAVFVGFSKRF